MSRLLTEEELIEKEIIEKCKLTPISAKLLKDMDEETYKEIATEVIFLAKPIIVAKTREITLKEVGESLEGLSWNLNDLAEKIKELKPLADKLLEFILALKRGEMK